MDKYWKPETFWNFLEVSWREEKAPSLSHTKIWISVRLLISHLSKRPLFILYKIRVEERNVQRKGAKKEETMNSFVGFNYFGHCLFETSLIFNDVERWSKNARGRVSIEEDERVFLALWNIKITSPENRFIAFLLSSQLFSNFLLSEINEDKHGKRLRHGW